MSTLDALMRKVRSARIEHLENVVARLQREYDSARGTLAWAEDQYANAAVDGSADLAQARKTLHANREATADAEAALLMGKARLQGAQTISESQSDALQKWGAAVDATDARNKALMDLEADIARLVSTWETVVQLTLKMDAALPLKPDLDGALLRGPILQSLLMRELWRQGLDWVWPASPSQRITTPSIEAEISGIPGMVRRWREEALLKVA